MDRRPKVTVLIACDKFKGSLTAAEVYDSVGSIIPAVGGGACTDGGAGFLQALGASLRSFDGSELPLGGGAVGEISTVNLRSVNARIFGCHFFLASDFDNVLTGPRGAARRGSSLRPAEGSQGSRRHEAGARALFLCRSSRTDPGCGGAGLDLARCGRCRRSGLRGHDSTVRSAAVWRPARHRACRARGGAHEAACPGPRHQWRRIAG